MNKRRKDVVTLLKMYDSNIVWRKDNYNPMSKYHYKESHDCEHYKLLTRLQESLGWRPEFAYKEIPYGEKGNYMVAVFVKNETKLYFELLNEGFWLLNGTTEMA